MEAPSNRKFYDRISAFYDGIAHANEREACEQGWRLLDVEPDEQVLEIGFGTGHSILEFATAVGENGHVTGVDVSQGMRNITAGKIQRTDLGERITLDLNSVPPLAYPSDQFDAVFLSFTLELFPLETIPILLAEIHRVLKPGGRLGLVSMEKPPAESHEGAMQHAYEWMHHHFPHIVDCQPIPASQLVQAAGFKITAQTHLEIWTLPVIALAAKG